MAESETRIAAAAVSWLERSGWTVYQEVTAGRGGSVADMVATSGSLTWIVEAKRSRTLDLLDQARGWEGQADLISVAVPAAARERRMIRSTWDWCCEQFGLGVFVCDSIAGSAQIRRWPRLCRRLAPGGGIARFLDEEQRTFCAAGSTSGYFTVFQRTARDLRQIVGADPGVRLAEAVERIQHHYASNRTAVSCLRKWISDGTIDGLRVERGRVYPVEVAS